MSTVFSESNEVLQILWQQHNPDGEEYLQKEKVIEWIKASLQKTNSLSNFQQSLTDLEGLIKQYLAEVHEVTEENTQSISLSYAEGVNFLKWLTNTSEEPNQKEEQEEEVEQQRQNNEYVGQSLDIANVRSSKHEQKQEQQSLQHPNDHLQAENNETNRVEEQNEPKGRHLQGLQDNPSNHSYNFKKQKHYQGNPAQIVAQPQKQNQKVDELTESPNQFNIDHLTRKYKDYLKIIFEHYCKLTYSTGQDPTFEQIMHKTTIMTITKFMMFSKDFQIPKYHNSINRSFLIEIFKKNSECYKEMSFEQFCQVIKKISEIGAQNSQVEASQDERSLISAELVKFLQFCEIDTSKKFREKMKKLNIAYRAGPKTNAELKVVPDGYRFKFTSNNGKSEEQIKQQLNQRKINRSQRRLFLQEKVNMSQNDLSLNKRGIKKSELNISKQSKPIRQTKVQSTQIINKILTPIIPPTKKPNQLPPAPPKLISTPLQSNQANSTHNNNSSNSSSNTNLFKKQLGYAQMHKIKQTQGYSRKRAITNSNSRSQNGKGTFKLNSIVEQARQQVLDAQAPHQGHTQNLSQSIATNSREQSQRVRAYDVSKINNRMQQISDKIKRDRQIQQQLNGLIDIQNDEQDQYLMQHLQREKKNESIVKRLSHRINELDIIK